MSLFKTVEGEEIGSEKEFDGGGGNFEPIPEGTKVLGMVNQISWDEPQDGSEPPYISITWEIVSPKDYLKRKIFQKLRVLHPDAKKANKARRMLAAIDAMHGGKLAKLEDSPTDAELATCLINKLTALKLGVYEMPPEQGGKSGNWVMAVAERGGETAPAEPVKPKSKPATASKPKPGTSTIDSFDDDIPF